ncbi:MAG: hypothetical protein PHV06_02510 [bacterium]|nr:hypothetical protein [bacterium]
MEKDTREIYLMERQCIDINKFKRATPSGSDFVLIERLGGFLCRTYLSEFNLI